MSQRCRYTTARRAGTAVAIGCHTTDRLHRADDEFLNTVSWSTATSATMGAFAALAASTMVTPLLAVTLYSPAPLRARMPQKYTPPKVRSVVHVVVTLAVVLLFGFVVVNVSTDAATDVQGTTSHTVVLSVGGTLAVQQYSYEMENASGSVASANEHCSCRESTWYATLLTKPREYGCAAVSLGWRAESSGSVTRAAFITGAVSSMPMNVLAQVRELFASAAHTVTLYTSPLTTVR